jgi:hypothetical protein
MEVLAGCRGTRVGEEEVSRKGRIGAGSLPGGEETWIRHGFLT